MPARWHILYILLAEIQSNILTQCYSLMKGDKLVSSIQHFESHGNKLIEQAK